MKKWIGRVLIAVAVLFLAAGATALVGWRLMRGTPEWYQPAAMTSAQREAALNSVMRKVSVVQNEAAFARADEQRSRKQAARPTTRPHNAITVSFTADELNGFFAEWSVLQGVRARYERFITEPYIALEDGRLILAGRMKEFNAVASLHFQPWIDDSGQLNLELVRVLAGRLPLPEAVIAQYQRQATGGIERRLPLWRHQAAIDSTGVANSAAISAVMGRMLVNVLHDKPADPILFVPLVGSGGGSIPVRLSDLTIEDHTLTLTVVPMTYHERAGLLERIRDGSPLAANAP